jgi:hypothetical protein
VVQWLSLMFRQYGMKRSLRREPSLEIRTTLDPRSAPSP